MLDVALLVPFQSWPSSWVEPGVRASLAATKLVAVRARDRLLEHIGRSEQVAKKSAAHRSLTAVALATSLERAGLSWRVLDPGPSTLRDWRSRLESLRSARPKLVAVSSTFVNDGFWIASLCALVRRILPDSKVAVGGYYYASDAKQFLSLDADIFCVGEGEARITAITQAIKDDRELDGIRGLYLRSGRTLRYTGDVEPLRLDELPLPDWSLSTRIEPPVDPRQVPLHYAVETQRGCVFKCEFCTFRTLAAPVLASVEHGVTSIVDAASRGDGLISVVDATASYPRDRWRALLERLIERGGSRLPLSVWARVSDIDEEISALMAKAGVRHLQIGQESGDQRMLNAMRKGTRVTQVAPAMAALGRNRITAHASFLFGFPGETHGSLATTRRLMTTMNDSYEPWPVVRSVSISLFDALDFAGVGQRAVLQDRRRFGWDHLEVTPAQAADAVLLTHLELSRTPRAPSSGFGVIAARSHHFDQTPDESGGIQFFHWAKALDRGIGIFVEEELEGKRPNRAELRRIRDVLVAEWPVDRGLKRVLRGSVARARHRLTWRVMHEWLDESHRGVGPLTRLALGWETVRATGRMENAFQAVRSGRYPSIGFVDEAEHVEARREAADQLIRLGVATGQRRLSRLELAESQRSGT